METNNAEFLLFSLIIGFLTRVYLKRVPIPYTVLLFIFGVILGIIYLYGKWSYYTDIITPWIEMEPHILLFIFIPALLFESGVRSNFHIMKKSVFQIFLLAFPGVIISLILISIWSKYVFPYKWSWSAALTFGSMMSATDPVAVVALLKDLGAPAELSYLIEGESLWNDGSAMVAFTVFLGILTGTEGTASYVIVSLLRLCFGGILLGYIFGTLLGYLSSSFRDQLADTTLTFVGAYVSFYIAENTILHVSGVLTLVTIGLTLARIEKLRHDGEGILEHFWEMIAYAANTVLFVLTGIIIINKSFSNGSVGWIEIGHLFLFYLIANIFRGIVVFILYPVLNLSGYKIQPRHCLVMSYSGLRGALGLVLSLVVDSNENVDRNVGNLMVFYMCGIVMLTNIINGSTSGLLVKYLGFTRDPALSQKILKTTIFKMHTFTEDTIDHLKLSGFLNQADWNKVWKSVPTLSDQVNQIRIDHRIPSSSRRLQFYKCPDYVFAKIEDKDIDVMESEDTESQEVARKRLLILLKASYWRLYDFGYLSRNSVLFLLNAANEASDHCSQELRIWDYCENQFQISKFFIWSSNKEFLRKIFRHLLLNHFTTIWECSTTFLIASRQIYKPFRSTVRKLRSIYHELDHDVQSVRNLLNEINLSFHDYLIVIQTSRASKMIVRYNYLRAHRFFEAGEIEQKELQKILSPLEIARIYVQDRYDCYKELSREEQFNKLELSTLISTDLRDELYKITQYHQFRRREKIIVNEESSDRFYIVSQGLVYVVTNVEGRDLDAIDQNGEKSNLVREDSLSSQSTDSELPGPFGSVKFPDCDLSVDEDSDLLQIDYNGRPILATMGPNGIFGAVQCLSGHNQLYTCYSETQVVECFSFERNEFLSFVHLHEELTQAFYRLIVLNDVNLLTDKLSHKSAPYIKQKLSQCNFSRPNNEELVTLEGYHILLEGSIIKADQEITDDIDSRGFYSSIMWVDGRSSKYKCENALLLNLRPFFFDDPREKRKISLMELFSRQNSVISDHFDEQNEMGLDFSSQGNNQRLYQPLRTQIYKMNSRDIKSRLQHSTKKPSDNPINIEMVTMQPKTRKN